MALSSPLTLPAGTWYTVAADVDGVDLARDKLTGTSFTTDDTYYSTGGWNSPYARYGNDPVSSEPLSGAYAKSVYPVVNLGLATVPEPSSVVLGAAGLLVLLVRRSFRR